MSHFLYNFEGSEAKGMLILNCIHVAWHGAGLFYFIQDVHNLISIVGYQVCKQFDKI